MVADFTEWLANRLPPWAAYWDLMKERLIALDKYPGVRPAGVGETWQQLMAKCILKVTGQEAKAACSTEQLTGGVEVGIEGGIHAMQLLWEYNS